MLFIPEMPLLFCSVEKGVTSIEEIEKEFDLESIKEIDFGSFKKAQVLAEELAKTNSILKTRQEIEA